MAMRNYLTDKTDFTGQYTCNDLRCQSATVTSMRPNCTNQNGIYLCNIPKEWCVRAVYIALQDQCHVRRCLRCVDLPTRTDCDLCEGIPNLLQINGPSDSVKYRDFWVKIECRDPVRLELHAIAYQCTNFTSLR
ncbi:hypothetical protein MAR_008796 [Mya arenaria]|uniref:Uncharacterized protein n=1 Tax=Mya arenaria TaxID=6604 RepID=A0ABY7DWY1_MYAAR|nr:hypothetical protein MAR_008796 [Mya arenaria]